MVRVVGVVADVPALDRVLDYVVPDGWRLDPEGSLPDRPGAPVLRPGTIVRIPLQGRRVRGWVVDLQRRPPTGLRLRPLAKVTGWGPLPDQLALGEWAAWRWAGRRLAFLRAASPDRAVVRLPDRRRTPGRTGDTPPDSGVVEGPAARALAGPGVTVVRLPPAGDPLPWLLAALSRGQALVLTPAQQDAARLAARLRAAGHRAARHPDGWAAAAAGASVVGSRAAAWMPAPDLAAVVVLDEHDGRYRDERVPTWHSREVAVERARRAGAPCLLVSPTPSLEALVAGRLLVPSRAEERAGWPVVEVIDRTTDPDPHRHGLYSPRLVDVLRGDQRVVVVLNRTGRARLLACQSCARLATCAECGAALSSPDAAHLSCPRCGAERPTVCAHCGATRLRLLRPGVARVREEIEALVGEPVLEVTAATEQGPGSLDARVVVGTEAVLHRAESADVVVFLDLDADLLAARFRAGEQTLGQLARAARLVGARERGGRLVLQTRQPHHEVVEAALHADPGRWARAEAARRRQLALPPFAALAQLSGPGAVELAAALGRAGLDVLGPLSGRYLVKAADAAGLADALAAVSPPSNPVRIEVDPVG